MKKLKRIFAEKRLSRISGRALRQAQELLAVIAIVCWSSVTWPQSFTLEQVLSSPSRPNLQLRDEQNRVASIFNARGERNVWVADGPAFVRSARQLTRYAGDDGQPLSSLRLTPDGKTVVYVRGTELNERQESADPRHNVQPPKQQAWLKSVESDEAPRLLGEVSCEDEGCEDIEISPDGKTSFFASDKTADPTCRFARHLPVGDNNGTVCSRHIPDSCDHKSKNISRKMHR